MADRPAVRRRFAIFGRVVTVLAIVALFAMACAGQQEARANDRSMASAPSRVQEPRTTPRSDPVPAALTRGEQLYQGNCASCHGERGAGSGQGPTFLSSIYAPNHHSDQAFVMAAQQGVRPHHWDFGPMPPVPGLAEADVREIIRYVRWSQGLSVPTTPVP